ncbi:endonuclease/exonuclease/phosphatase family protein [Pyxidicoccus sp. MSG2]|uniref:endonuclease/exonuclease/phosphatase family protein n=1 Tax=Pyxidicoccus sp. MSG2 TaxID=2996790 RepID=UPI00226E546D|nr:endonuclease/exonuclease/phosphatase family protein [Pyxidicoccus sp. MSG2]MCY1019041.1 endonuclease/exonuclease/phosphatase family protein [Pyxidicoccus sp. MSG2]
MTLRYVTSGIGAGRERQVDGVTGAPTTDNLPTYLFRQAQKSLTFTATAADPARGVTSVKLQGTLNVICMQRRSDVLLREGFSTQTFTFSNQNSATTTASSRTTSLSINFKSYAEETRCPTDYLPYRQDFSLVAESTDGNGGVLKTPLKRYVFVQSFKVATFNILNGVDVAGVGSADRLAQHMNDRNDIDVVMLQESRENTVWGITASPYIKELSRQVRFSGNDDLTVMSKFPISENVPVQFSQPLEGYNHRWHYVVLDLGGFPVKVANLHLIAGSVAENRGIPEVPYRRQEVDEVMAHMRNPGMPAIIGGDMNADVFRTDMDPLFTYVRYEFEFFYYTPPYKHFCLPPSTGCHVTPETPPRYNLDQLWVWVSTPGFGFVDSYTAYDRLPHLTPYLSDHRMQVTRLYINE